MSSNSDDGFAFDPQLVADRTLGIGAEGIDRRTCKRTVPMRLLCLGPSRTGTTSLREGLLKLGYRDCYHYGSLMIENPRDAEMWHEAWDANFDGQGSFERADWDQLLGHCQAVTDVPCCIFYRQLLEAYPEAKVIITKRDSPEQWHKSMLRTVIPMYQRYYLPSKTWWIWFYRFFLPSWTPRRAFDKRMCNGYQMYVDLDEDEKNGTRKAIQWLENYYDEVRRIVPEDRLLVYNVSEGWKPLCEFLDEKVPGIEFPDMNSTRDWDVLTAPAYAVMDQYAYTNMAKFLGAVLILAIAFLIGLLHGIRGSV